MLDLLNKTEFTELFFKGANYKELADKYFVSKSTIYNWIKFLKLDRTRLHILEPKLKELFYSGLNSKEIAKVFGSNESTIKIYIKKYGLNYIVKNERIKNNKPRKSYIFGGMS